MSKPLDINKPLQWARTAVRIPIRLIHRLEGTSYPNVAVVGIGNGQWITQFNDAGRLNTDAQNWSPAIENTPPEKRTGYINIYKTEELSIDSKYHLSATRSKADMLASYGRIACVKIEYTEGQFDE